MKKLMSILLAVMMLASAFSVSVSAFVPERTDVYTEAEVYLNQDFSDTTLETAFTGTGADDSASGAYYSPTPFVDETTGAISTGSLC